VLFKKKLETKPGPGSTTWCGDESSLRLEDGRTGAALARWFICLLAETGKVGVSEKLPAFTEVNGVADKQQLAFFLFCIKEKKKNKIHTCS
jgi:hypothetical protein